VAEAKAGTKYQRRKRSAQRKTRDNRPNFDLGAELQRLLGVDLRIIDGIDLMTAQTLYSELGPDLSAWPTEKHFTSRVMRHILSPRTPHAVSQPSSQIGDRTNDGCG